MTDFVEIKGFPGYKINRAGKVISSRKPEGLSPYDNTTGYLKVDLYKKGKKYKKYVHILVALAFIPRKKPQRLFCEVDHKDGVKSNVHESNLQWMSRPQNAKKMHRMRKERQVDKHSREDSDVR